MKADSKAHIYIIIASILFGANYWIAKGLMPDFLTPVQIVFLRIIGALCLFWIFQLVFKTGGIAKQDHLRLALSGLFGVALNQFLFFKGLSLTSPIDTAIIHASSPVMVVVFALIILKEKVNFWSVAGIICGLAGALLLITEGKDLSFADSRLSGNIMIFLNILFYSLYLVIVKPLMLKYHPVTVMKWVFVWGFIIAAPFTLSSLPDIAWGKLSPAAWGALLYVVIGTTFIAYLLTTFSLRNLSASVVGYYIYSQPLIAALIGLIIGTEAPTIIKSIAGIMIFVGVYLVNRKKSVKPKAILTKDT